MELRTQVNQYFVKVLPEGDYTNKDYSDSCFISNRRFPELIDFYIRYKEDTGDEAVSVSRIPCKTGRTTFYQKAQGIC